MSTNITERQTIESLCAARDLALAKAFTALDLLNEAHGIADRQVGNYAAQFLSGNGAIDTFYCHADGSRLAEVHKRMRTKLDQRAWERVLDLSGARGLMDATALDEFRKQLDKEPPEFTRENVAATVHSLYEDRELIFRRGLVTAFEAASGKRLVTNRRGGQGIPHRIIMERVLTQTTGQFSYGFWSHYGRSDQCVNDLDRVFHILDGKIAPTDNLIAWRLSDEGRKVGRGVRIETEYMTFLPRKNGNLEITFKRPDLLEKANRIMAGEAGNTLRAA